MAELLPRFYAALERRADERRLLKILEESGALAAGDPSLARKVLTRSADGHDPARLRGLPAIGRNVTGAIRDTDPVRALLAKENGRRQ